GESSAVRSDHTARQVLGNPEPVRERQVGQKGQRNEVEPGRSSRGDVPGAIVAEAALGDHPGAVGAEGEPEVVGQRPTDSLPFSARGDVVEDDLASQRLIVGAEPDARGQGATIGAEAGGVCGMLVSWENPLLAFLQVHQKDGVAAAGGAGA